MKNKRIQDRTVKDIFVAILGEENANIFLTRVQAEYDKGVRGEELEKFAKDVFNEFKIIEPGSVRLVVAVIAIVVI